MNDLSLGVSDADLEAYRDARDPYRHVRDIAGFRASVEVSLSQPELCPRGDSLPWPKTAGKIAFLPGEVTLWHGINGHGKSAVTTQIGLWWAILGKPVCLASFEMLPIRTIERMVKQCAGTPNPSERFVGDFFDRMAGRVWIYDVRGSIDPTRLFAVIRYAASELQIRHFFVDSLMKCVKGEDDYNGQKDFVGMLCQLAHETGIHIHLVHHVRKGQTESIPSKFDAKGSGAITDQADNVIAVWRNKAKEAERQLGDKGAVDESAPDFLLICDKQRNVGWEGKIGLWGDLETWHFRESQEQPWSKGYELPRQPGDDDA